jgi:hypothetical protein
MSTMFAAAAAAAMMLPFSSTFGFADRTSFLHF